MNTETFASFLSNLKLGEPQEHRALVVFPIVDGPLERTPYIGLATAVSRKTMSVTEVSEGGSVPDLKVMNKGKDDVLILDGEEMAGARQNRIFNTAILVGAKSAIKVPVSCSEAGRWSYARRDFGPSGHFASRDVRMSQRRSVSDSLRFEESFRSDQGEVWDRILEMQERAEFRSPTSAMRDVYEGRRDALSGAGEAFVRVEGQRGLIALTPDGTIGLDYVSRAEMYAVAHERIVRSYLFDAIWRERTIPDSTAVPSPDVHVREFLDGLRVCGLRAYESPGKGMDIRIQSKTGFGNALDLDGEIVYFGAFSANLGAGSRNAVGS